MADAEIACPKCKQVMREGFLPDLTYGGAGAVSWVEGKPPKGYTPTMRLGFKLQWTSIPRVPVTAYRCLSCGYLEFYAR